MNTITPKTIDPPSWLVIFTTSLVGFWVLGNLLRVSLPIGASIYPHDILLVLLCAFNWQQVITISSQAIKKIKKNPLLLASLAWLVLGWGVALVTGAPVALGISYAARLMLYLYGLHILITCWKNNPLPIHTKTKDVFISLPVFITSITVFFSLLGLLQYIYIPDTRFLASLGWDDHYYRLLSTQLDPNFAGIIIAIGLVAATALQNFVWKYTSFGILALSILLTWSRASWLALGIGLIWLAGKKTPKKVVLTLFALFCFVTVVLVIPKPSGEGGNILRTSTIISRYQNAIVGFSDLKPYQWIIGNGLFIPVRTGEGSVTNNARLPDAWPITVLNGVGVLGSIMLAGILLENKNLWKNVAPHTQAAVLSVLVHGLFNNTVTQPFVFLGITTILITQLTMKTSP